MRHSQGLKARVDAYGHRLSSGEPGRLPVVLVLVAIWAVFESLNSAFLSPRNLSNLSVDIVGTGLIAVGIIFVLLIGEIDLSVAAVSGLAATMFAVLNVQYGMPEWLAVIVGMLCGAAVGAVQGFIIAKVGVPAFVVTLAGLLGWNGLMLYVLGTSATISLDDKGLVAALTNTYFNHDAVAYGVAALVAGAILLASYQGRRRRKAVGMPSRPLGDIWLRTGGVAAIAFTAAYVLNQFQGMPLALLIFLVVIAGLDLILRHTLYGRKVGALGGGIEATRRAGVNVVRIRISVFVVSGTMAAIGGLFLASRITSVSQSSGSANLLVNAIAAAVIGGTSLFGGRGRTWSALLGMLVIQSIASGVALLGVQRAIQSMITGGVLLAAVVIDSLSRRSRESHSRPSGPLMPRPGDPSYRGR
ncbi:sugar ABC transporter permease [Streptomyces sp. NPDC020681]|uniref:sugar ABC transporter permease n=1 Tax=Streptomyces sp. NPDC020681 TaxID=3365083 RepID=UPI0037BB685A